MKLTRKQWMMLAVLVLGAFVTVLNQTLVTPALPSIMVEMSVDQSTAQWLTTGLHAGERHHDSHYGVSAGSILHAEAVRVLNEPVCRGTLLAAVGLNFPVLLGGRLVQAGRRRHPHAGDHDRAYAGVPG